MFLLCPGWDRTIRRATTARCVVSRCLCTTQGTRRVTMRPCLNGNWTASWNSMASQSMEMSTKRGSLQWGPSFGLRSMNEWSWFIIEIKYHRGLLLSSITIIISFSTRVSVFSFSQCKQIRDVANKVCIISIMFAPMMFLASKLELFTLKKSKGKGNN